MTRAERLATKLACALGTMLLVSCLVVAEQRAAAFGDPQQGTTTFNPPTKCPDASLSSIDKLDPNKIIAIKQGIQGLPCDAVAERSSASITDKLQRGFDYYSWLTFIALNSPAPGTAPIGNDAQTVWETWKQLPDVMLEGGKEPAKWSEPNNPVKLPLCGGKFKSGMMIIRMDMEETYNEPFKSGPLFDQNGNYALFVILMNHQMFQYIADHHLYSRAGQRDFDEDVDFPSGSITPDHEAMGAIMIKASWRVLTPDVDYDPNNPSSPKIKPKFHMTDGLLYLPGADEPCRQVKLGLIGFHVGHKTDTRQQWIWTTFEHVDNVPTQKEVEDGSAKRKHYGFYDPNCSTCAINQTPAGPWDPQKLNPPWDPVHHPSHFKSQIVRTGPSPIFDDIEKLNGAFHQWLHGTVWENYDLVATQWPSGSPCASNPHPGSLPDATCAPFPAVLANTTLETFSQQEKDAGVPTATSSCISCHNSATTQHDPATRSDFTYILEKAQGPINEQQAQRPAN